MKQLILDTNLLVLLIVGLSNENLISKHKRTRQFNKEDFKLLRKILIQYKQIVVTPHILTETSNLISQIDEPYSSIITKKFASILSSYQENHEFGASICEHPNFIRLGITDCGILNLLDSDTSLLTTDLELYLTAAKQSKLVFNFTHIRNLN